MTHRSVDQWETRFRAWAGGPGDTELERCDNAERMIRKATAASSSLNTLDIEIFAQGSFRNITNIAQESDVDVCICLREAWYYELPEGTEAADFLIVPATLDYDTYKQSIVAALAKYFGAANVTTGKKAIRIHSNSYRVDADVVPAWEFHEYYDVQNPSLFRAGIRFYSQDGTAITSYPKQHIENGIEKNENTKKRFKRMARILKSLQVEMIDQGILSKALPSFLIESLVYNVHDDQFGSSSYRDDVQNVLAHIFNNTRPTDDCSRWTEVNGIKFLFHATQPWSQQEAHAFTDAAWNYVGFDQPYSRDTL